jgi:hypothetical protein
MILGILLLDNMPKVLYTESYHQLIHKGVKIMNDLAIINPNNLDISKPAQFAEFVAQAKALANVLEEAWGVVEQQMLDRNVKSLKGDWGSISTAERINWKVTADVDPYYLKTAPDTKKLRAAFDAGELPTGADFSTSVYITKRLKG